MQLTFPDIAFTGTNSPGGWQGTSTGSTSVTMSDVAKVVGAAGSGLDGTGVGVALIDTGIAPVPGLPAARMVNGPDAFTFAIVHKALYEYMQALDGHLERVIGEIEASAGEALATARA